MKAMEDKKFAAEIRKACLRQFKGRGFGHLGGSFSVADLIAVLYNGVMKIDPQNPEWEDRDWLVLSKGHAGPALYSALALKGFFPMDELDTLNQPGTNLPSHPDRMKTKGVDTTTGSLGQGISQAAGVALGFKLQKKDNYVYSVVGDGEANEGQVWEAALFAPQQKLDNLIVFVDDNKQQLDGYTKDVCSMGDIKAKFDAFDWRSQSIDGHDTEQIKQAIETAKQQKGKPSVIVLNTVKAKGFQPLEGAINNHHVMVTDEQMDQGIAVLENYLKELEK